jgi:molybdate transport system substrate-binding protein
MSMPKYLAVSPLGAAAFGVALTLTLLAESPQPAGAAELRIYTSGAPAEVQKTLAPKFTAKSGDPLSFTIGPLAAIQARLNAGEKADVVVFPTPIIERLDKAGLVRAASRVDLARVGIGVVVREGAPRPDVSSVDGLRKALLDARSIAHPDPTGGGFTGAQIARIIERLGIADAVKPKVKLAFAIAGGVDSIANGDSELGLFNISEILPVKGVTLVGPLPRELQSYITFAGAIHSGSAAPEAASTYLRSLAAPDAQDAWKKGGFEPLQAEH